ncbi:epoxide hydrolase 4-like [Diorhabda sublineata]|uniref:epoxide hydrolase 4-like n=1 Tax=Diorhabda sublineata TaxID=1163346 RepID=UPI0024E0AB92|nr:epoxide hydrolase 4-like [Diorhabda sublineata]
MAICIQSISVIDTLKIHVFSLLFGVWVIVKRFSMRIWDPKRLHNLQIRDTPPSCLLDSSLGQHNYVKLKGVKFHYVEAGTNTQPLVLLLHGFPDFWLSWRYQIPILKEHFRVVSLDLKGFGDSDKPLWRKHYKIFKILEEIKDFIRSLGVTDCIIIGHDLGALVGWYFIYQYPNLVKKFFVISCPHPNIYWGSLKNTSNTYQWLNFVQVPYLPEIDALKENVKIINQYHSHLSANDVYLETYKYSFSRKEDWTGPINYYRDLRFRKIKNESKNITSTVIFVIGDRDEMISLESIVKSSEYCEKFHIKIIENAGHFPHQENPKNFNGILLRYMFQKLEISRKAEGSGKRLMKRILGAVNNTVKIGNTVFDNIQKKTTDVVSTLPTRLSLNYMQSNIVE